jgi:hypothetical protein
MKSSNSSVQTIGQELEKASGSWPISFTSALLSRQSPAIAPDGGTSTSLSAGTSFLEA